MTDKQIIIDGVDVSGCKNFSCGKCEEENKIPITINHFTADCRMYPNCHYKQLKRKEQECEELKKWKENVINLFDKTCRCKYLNKESAFCNFYNKECIAINQCLYKNQQTLTQIKEIAENSCCLQPTSDCEEYKNCDECSRTSDDVTVQQILQKISECEVE